MIKMTSKCRVHVERVISYLMTGGAFTSRTSKCSFVHVCGFLTNLQKVHLAESGTKLVQVQKQSGGPTPGPSQQRDISARSR